MKRVKETPDTCLACRAKDDLERGNYAITCKWVRRKECIDIAEILPLMEIVIAAKKAQMKSYFEENPEAKALIEEAREKLGYEKIETI